MLEVPVKRILMGRRAEQAASRESLANPAALDYFVARAAATLQDTCAADAPGVDGPVGLSDACMTCGTAAAAAAAAAAPARPASYMHGFSEQPRARHEARGLPTACTGRCGARQWPSVRPRVELPGGMRRDSRSSATS